MFRRIVLSFFLLFVGYSANAGDFKSFVLVSHTTLHNGAIAENICTTPKGNVLFYTNIADNGIGILDIADPKSPKHLGFVSTGESRPTSVAVSPDGNFLVCVVRNGDDAEKAFPGTLLLYDIKNPKKPASKGKLPIGVGPNSAALATIQNKLVAVVAIKDEESDEHGRPTLGGKRPGRVDVICINKNDAAHSSLTSIEFPAATLQAVAGVNFSLDPKPEFVTINSKLKQAAVSLQDNNAVALIDIADPNTPKLQNIFCAGITDNRPADLKRDKQIFFTDNFKGRREPKMLAYVAKGKKTWLALANEGNTHYTPNNATHSGGRSLSLHDIQSGECIWESNFDLERKATLLGHYPDRRSEKRGIEIECITTANFFNEDFLVATSERGSFLVVYKINSSGQGEFVQIIPTGEKPEDLIAIRRTDGKNLLITPNKGDGTLTIYQASTKKTFATPSQPLIFSKKYQWGSLSGLTTDGKYLYSVGDHTFTPSKIWRLNMVNLTKGRIEIDKKIILTKKGYPVHYDLEGICRSQNGFWLVAEGKKAEENLLIFADNTGKIQKEIHLSERLIRKHGAPIRYGFEGITLSPDEKTVFIAMQRGFNPANSNAAILRYDIESKKWTSAWYPLCQTENNPRKYRNGISALTHTKDGRLLVIERDNAPAFSAKIKRIYSVPAKDIANNKVLNKTLVCDLLESNILQTRPEGICLLNGEIWIVNDNNGGGWTQIVNLGKLK